MRGPLAAALTAATLGVTLAGQGGAVAPSPPQVVQIDAVVTDARGRPVRDLKAEDFTVVEDGAPDKVDTATFVAANGAGAASGTVVPVLSRGDEQAEASRSGARLFAIFLDEYHVASGAETDAAREVVKRFIQTELGPGDLAVVVKPLDSIVSFRMTHDRDELAGTVATFEGRRGDYTPKNDFERNYFAAAPVRIESVRAQIVVSALDALATHLGSLQPGRKTILLVSDGFSRQPRRREDGLPTSDSVARNANRTGVSIYAFDPRALVAGASANPPATDPAPEHEVLRVLASETDGTAAFTASEAAGELPRMVADASGYYNIAFHPAHPLEFQALHPVEVRVRRAGLTVHARKGYWPTSAEDLLRERGEHRVDVASSFPPQPMRHVSPLIHPWFGVARASDPADGTVSKGLMQVSFVWQAVPPIPGDRVRQGPPAVISVRATNATSGALVFAGDVRASTGAADGSHDLPNELAFLSPPGRLILQLQIQDADANVLDTDVRDVLVGGLTGPVEVGTPEVLRAGNARDLRALDADDSAAPVAVRDFERADHLIFRLPVYAGDAPVTVTATLASKPGSVMRELPVEARPGADVYQTDLSLAGMATGDYVVTIAAKGSGGDASESVAFRVVP